MPALLADLVQECLQPTRMNCLMEVLGMTVPGNGTIVATSDERHELIRQAARHLIELVKKDIRPRDIINKRSNR